ncbi:MAG: putative flap endonuclease-1-like 5' DNA nuclease [Saprospiraceae bacterium]|jgi:predicted flap endonuclease-1-like 5' DNA nuclease
MLKKQYQKNTCKVTFTLPTEAIEAKDVRVLGEFNNWNWENGIKMKAVKGEFKAVAELPAGQHQFRYMAENGAWENDFAADAYIATPFNSDNSVVFVDEVSDVPAKKTVAKKVVAKKVAKPVVAKKTVAKKVTKPVVAKKAVAKPVAKKVVTKKATTTKAKADNLTKIEGVGPKIASLLIADGIVTFVDLSKAELTQLETVLKNAGPRFKMHKPTTWAEQAKLAAKGNWAELKKLQDALDGGKRK